MGNWAGAFEGAASGLDDILKVKEKEVDVEMENIRQANYARLRKEMAQENRDWNDSRDARMRQEKLDDRDHTETRKVATDEKAHQRAIELQEVQNKGRVGGASGGIFGKISASGVWTPESMEMVSDQYEKTGEIDYGSLVFAIKPTAGQTRQQFLNDLLGKLSSMDPDMAPSSEEKKRLLEEAGREWDNLNQTEEKPKSPTGSVFESKDFGGEGNPGSGNSPFMLPGREDD